MIYVASKTRHAALWRSYRSKGFPINSTWIDQAGAGESDSPEALWGRCVNEAKKALVLVAYVEPGDTFKGMLVEIGAALAFCRPVITVGPVPDEQTWKNHALVQRADTLPIAMQRALFLAKR